MRPRHYIKNLLIFVPMVFDLQLFSPSSLLCVLGGFAAFSLLASAVYIFNDIHDADSDRLHEVKKNRPIASGAVSITAAYVLAGLLLASGAAIHLICGFGMSCVLIAGLYFVVNLGYSMGLKHIPILDIVLLMLGFLLRVMYGAAIIKGYVSSWVYLTIISLSFYLGLGKRRNELRKAGGGIGATRKVLSFYSYEFLDKFMYLCLTLAIAFYALWSADKDIAEKFGTDKLVWTVPMVIVLMMKYSADIESNSYGDPVDVITHDKWLMVLSGLFAIILMGLIYLPRYI